MAGTGSDQRRIGCFCCESVAKDTFACKLKTVMCFGLMRLHPVLGGFFAHRDLNHIGQRTVGSEPKQCCEEVSECRGEQEHGNSYTWAEDLWPGTLTGNRK